MKINFDQIKKEQEILYKMKDRLVKFEDTLKPVTILEELLNCFGNYIQNIVIQEEMSKNKK